MDLNIKVLTHWHNTHQLQFCDKMVTGPKDAFLSKISSSSILITVDEGIYRKPNLASFVTNIFNTLREQSHVALIFHRLVFLNP